MTDLTDLTRLTAELTGLSRGFDAAELSLAEPASGSDAAGAVTVTLDERGRVDAVRPSSRWRELIASDQVGDAVVEAAQAAQLARLDRWSEVLDAQPNTDAGDAVTMPEPDVDLAALHADAPFVDLLGMVGEVTATLEQVMRGIGQPRRAAEVDTDPGETTAIGSRPVVVHLDAAAAVDRVDIELRWIAGADRGRLADALTDAFTRAYDAIDRATVSAPLTRDELPPMSPQLRELVRNPAGALVAFASHL